MKTTPWACAAVVAALVAAVNGQEAAPAPRSVAVEAVEEPATAETEGALEGLSALPVRLRPEAYGGPWYVEGLPLADGTTVEAGARLAALSAPRLDDAVREATEALEGARVRLENQRRSTERAQAQHDTAVERSELERDLAERGYRFFVENEGPRMLRGAELGVQSREHRLADEQEELSQLEGMYERSELAGETQEIVVARARRELAMSEAWLGLERAREEQVRLHEHPTQLARLELELRSRALAAELQAVEREVALSRRDLELREAEARVRDATERLARLERDRAALEVRSPAAGLWTTGAWEPADEVRAGQVLGRVADTSGWAVSA
ncbi:MAG: hypothetical protein HY722_10625, partial [Planctomycetes bacterium]|nr:hypothetical protein [Planctomycetota bacterium]